MVRVICSLMMLTWCFNAVADVDTYEVVNDGPIHEAFVVKESGSLILEPAPYAPPPKITELIPKQKDMEAIWIPGYWSWSCRHGVFVWTSGVWRKPPPQMQWIPGYWKNYPQGWVWISGFWTAKPHEKQRYVSNPPPEAIDQRLPSPPSFAGNYFWVPGNWQFDYASGQYIWYAGRWDIVDKNWVYCPAHYVWREEGYIFVPGFWDWPVQIRGESFANIYVHPVAIESFVYSQGNALNSFEVMEQLFPYWPDYASLFQYHYFFNFNSWAAWGAIPPWWNWSSWSTLPYTANWALWWWWTNPGYPNPTWLTPEVAENINPAPQFVVKMMSQIVPPLFVTRKGIVSEQKLYQALVQSTGLKLPIFPLELKQIEKIQRQAAPQKISRPLIAKGQQHHGNIPEKPFFGPPLQDLKAPPRRVILPPRPLTQEDSQKESTPPIKKVIYRRPSPYSNPYMQPVPRPAPPTYQNPWQGYEIQYEYPQIPMQSKHLNNIMGRPQPQINPSGPNVHPTPGDYSTLPGQ